MTTKNFNRAYTLNFGQPGEEGLSVSGLHITFSIKRDSSDSVGSLDLTIYNLSDSSVQEISRKNTVLELFVGYETAPQGKIFAGGISTITTYRDQSGNRVTELTAIDGLKAIKESASNRKAEKGSTLKTILTKIAQEDMGLDIGEINLGSFDKEYPNGYIALGSSKRIIDSLCRENHLRWSIENGIFSVIQSGTVSLDVGFVISSETGLITPPKKKTGNPTATTANTEEAVVGVSLKTFINPYYKLNQPIVLESKYYNGGVPTRLKIKSFTHKGSFEGGDWLTELELEEIINE